MLADSTCVQIPPNRFEPQHCIKKYKEHMKNCHLYTNQQTRRVRPKLETSQHEEQDWTEHPHWNSAAKLMDALGKSELKEADCSGLHSATNTLKLRDVVAKAPFNNNKRTCMIQRECLAVWGCSMCQWVRFTSHHCNYWR